MRASSPKFYYYLISGIAVMGSGMDSGEVDGSGSSEVDSTILAQIFLLAVPLLSAPVAFYFNSKQASNYSLGLEFLIIGVLVLEFLILVVLKSGAFSERGIYPNSVSIERFEVSLICDKCGEHFRYSLFVTMSRGWILVSS